MRKYKWFMSVTLVVTILWVVAYWQIGVLPAVGDAYQKYGLWRVDIIIAELIWIVVGTMHQYGGWMAASFLLCLWAWGRDLKKADC